MHHLHQAFSQPSPSKTLHWQSAFTNHKASTTPFSCQRIWAAPATPFKSVSDRFSQTRNIHFCSWVRMKNLNSSRMSCGVSQTENIYQGVKWYHRDSVNRFLAKRTVLLVAPAPHRTCIGERFSQSKWTCSTRQCKTKGAVFKQNTEQHPTGTWRALSGQKQIIARTHTFFHINHMVTATVTVWEIFIPCSAQRQREFFAPSTS